MSNLPKKYLWLEKESGPIHITEAIKLFGKGNAPASGNNVLESWEKEIGLTTTQKDYDSDAISWNGVLLSLLAHRAKWQLPPEPLWALNWNLFGTPASTPMLGDVLTFLRPLGGVAGIYIGEDKAAYHVIAPNLFNEVSIYRLDKRKCYRFRRPPYPTLPLNVRVVKLTVGGGLV